MNTGFILSNICKCDNNVQNFDVKICLDRIENSSIYNYTYL